ncbi:cytochrome P450 [Aestuariibius sp. HNIBRBA575]|uniref:cytochrome P450 n=1 Tax=Aestuariibius sp. HNIBRBA575 TaxID=3233343 RepID=UPI0034A13EC2
MVHDLNNTDFLRNPGPKLRALQTQGAFVQVKLPLVGVVWATTNDETARQVLKDTENFARNTKNATGRSMAKTFWWMPPFLRPLLRNPAQLDGAEHIRLRHLVTAAFTKTAMETRIPAIQQIANQLLDQMPLTQEVDLMGAYCQKIPMLVICDVMGIPEADRAKVAAWVNPMTQISGGPSFARALPGIWRIARYFRTEFENVRQNPRPGLISDLVQAEQNGDRLSNDELLAMVMALFVAGHETTANLMGFAIAHMLDTPENVIPFKDDPSRWNAFTEEVLRHESPVMLTNIHYAKNNINISGHEFEIGDKIVLLLIGANRDPNRFTDPDQFQPDRVRNPHIGFGYGPHICVGMQLARVELRVALQTLFERFPEIQPTLKQAELPLLKRVGLRGYKRLPVRLRQSS